jgi:hypothetical protein
MPFLAPLALLGLTIAIPIVAMYVLKLRRADLPISSTFLWRQLVRDVEANAPWQRLTPNLLLFLQLLALLLLVFALARPFLWTHGIAGRNLILIIDRSASMGATDIAQSRLAAAKEQALDLIRQLPDDGQATVIAAGGEMDVPVSAMGDQRRLQEAIESITLRYGGGSDLSQPLALAASLATREDQSEVAIISDGNVHIPEELTMPATVRYFPVGESRGNVGISAFSLQPNAAGQTLFAQAINYGESIVQRRLDIYLDGVLFNAYNIVLQPQQERNIVAEIPAEVGVAEARLSEDPDDFLPLDDRAWAVSTATDEINIRVVGPGNRFLTTGLDLLPGVSVTHVSTATATLATLTSAQYPLTVFDGVVPPQLPEGNLFFIAPPRSTDFFSVTGTIDFPTLRPVASDEPLLRNVSLRDVSILQSLKLSVGSWARVAVESELAPLLAVGERDGRRIAILSFALHQSDLPLQVAFPLLLSNLVSYLVPGSGAEAAQLAPGQPLAMRIDPAITDVRLTLPSGKQLSSREELLSQQKPLRIENNQLVYADTDMLGIYTVELFQDDQLQARYLYAVNLFSPTESNITPKADLAISQVSGLQTAVTEERVGKDELWRWLAALALIVLLVEWAVYHRGGIALLWRRWRVPRPTTT